MRQYLASLNKWYKALPIQTQIIIFVVVLVGPSAFRYVFQHNSWATYTDKRFDYSIEYPAHLWKSVSYAGWQGNREIHLLLAWPASIEITHQISVGEVGMTSPTLEEVAAFAEEIRRKDGVQDMSDLEMIQVNGREAVTRTYMYSDRKYKEVYFAEGGRGYFLRFTAVSWFYESSLKDFDQVVDSFRVSNADN